uniref:hypothetical protein n=1 Tax=Fusobacterium mortiferum TaxID=850 RepID=UPI00195B458D
AKHILRTNNPVDGLNKLNKLKQGIDSKKNVDKIISDNEIMDTNPNLDFNAQVSAGYNEYLNSKLGEPSTNSIWVNPGKEIQD